MYKAGMYKYIKDENRYMLSRASKKKRQEVLQNFKAMMFAMANLKRMTFFFSKFKRSIKQKREEAHSWLPTKKAKGGGETCIPREL